MADLVNLRHVKKQRAKAAESAVAEANRLVHGQTRAQKKAQQAARALATRVLDQAKLDKPTTTD